MKKTIIHNEYNTNQDNKMIIRIPYKDSYMQNNSDNQSTSDSQNMKVILQFPDTSDNTNYIIDEVRLILLDIFEKNIKKQFFTNTAP